jgi:glycerol uptake facilitator-like aquaporin
MGIERKLGVEFIGTFFLVLTVGMAVATAGTLAPLANGAALMVTAAGLRWPRRVAAPRRPDPARSAFSPGASR